MRMAAGRPTGRRRRERTETMTMDRGGVWSKGRQGRGRPCHCDAGGGDGNVGRRNGTVKGAAGVGADETEGEAARATAFRRNTGDAWLGRGRGWRSGAGRGGGDVGRRTGDAAEAAGGGTVAAMPLLLAGMHFRRSSRETVDRPTKRRRLRRWRRRRHGRLAC
uniref:Uncharacterized protein n=1 Tax=Oryza sativa subsp. japonica TaxID=39947 RepID=Q2R0T9_ORYSJ|nr:hypothetical protein LOC_Os11g41440 [Oryza sativa Japonica Group]